MKRIVVIGGGQAGASLVARLRSRGYDGALTLVGEEPLAPYQRPPLSKGYLLGEMEAARLLLRPEAFYADQRIDLMLGRPVDAIDRLAKVVHVGADRIPYDRLALTTGAAPRRLPAGLGGDLAGVHAIRTLADIDRLRVELSPGRHVLIVGGGYIGLEAAAVARKLDLEVTLVESASRILQRVAAPETARYFHSLHERHGVRILPQTGLVRLDGEGGRVSAAVLADGRVLPVDLVIVGIGVAPETALAAKAGLDLRDGIAVDEEGRTSDPSIWAAGDCASFPVQGGRMRLESVGHARDHAECVADNMLDANRAYLPKPWFWSDQYDVKLQIAGLNAGYDRIVHRPGADGAASFWYYAGERLLAVDAANDPGAYMVGKRIIEAGKSLPPDRLSDPAANLKDLLAQAS